MAGIDNTIIFSSGERLLESTLTDIIRMQATTDSVSRINYEGDPEGFVSANPSSLCHDPVSGNIYFKQTGTSNTGWSKLNDGLSFDSITPTSGTSPVLPTSLGNLSMLGQDGLSFIGSTNTVTVSPRGAGSFNMFLGQSAGNAGLSGSSNVILGAFSGTALTSAGSTTCVGVSSGRNITSGANNTCLGASTLTNLGGGSNNTAAGATCLTNNVSGDSNCGYGVGSLKDCTSSGNCAFGSNSLLRLTSGTRSVAMGQSAGSGVLTNNDTTAIGDSCIRQATGGGNTALGSGVAQGLLSGTNNLLLGLNSGSTYTGAESSNILLDSAGVVGESNVTRIGTSQTQFFAAGISGVTVAASVAVLIDANGQMGTVLSSRRFKENIENLEENNVLKLRPVTFNYISDETKYPNVGLIAEEVKELIPELVIKDDEGIPYTVKYQELCIYLLHELKRMNQRIVFLEKHTNTFLDKNIIENTIKEDN